jgi:hypothetical protein
MTFIMQCAHAWRFEHDQRHALAAPLSGGVRRFGHRAGKWADVVLRRSRTVLSQGIELDRSLD